MDLLDECMEPPDKLLDELIQTTNSKKKNKKKKTIVYTLDDTKPKRPRKKYIKNQDTQACATGNV